MEKPRYRVRAGRSFLPAASASATSLVPTAAPPAYDAAGSGPRISSWRATPGSANLIVHSSGETLRARARDMVRKNPFAEETLDKYVSNAIGTGIRPAPLHPEEGQRQAIREAWARWADEADADGVTNFYGLQALAVRSMVEGGDCFAHLRARLPEDGLSVPLQVQLLEAEMVPLAKTERLAGDRRIRTGIEFDAVVRRTAYHMCGEHPGEFTLGLARNAGTTSPVPAATVAHVFRPLRPGQVRGVTGLATVLLRLYELDQFDDASLVKQKIAAALTGFIETPLDENSGQGGLGTGTRDPNDAAAELVQFMHGTFRALRTGERVTFADAPEIGAGTGDLLRHFLRAVAAGGGVTYEQLTGDLSGVNYSSIRAGLLEFRREVEQFQQCFFVFQFCRPVWRRFIRDAIVAGTIPAPDFRQFPNRYLDCRWVPHGFKWVDPLKEVAALVKAIQMSGYDPEVIDAQIAADNAHCDEYGLSFDSDGRRLERSGRQGAPRDEDETQDDEERMDFPNIISRVFNTPLAIDPHKAATVLRVLGPRLGLDDGQVVLIADDVQALGADGDRPEQTAAVPGVVESRKPYVVTDRGVAVIGVTGTLVHRAAARQRPMSGLTSYGACGRCRV